MATMDTVEVARLVGLPYRTVCTWVESGIIELDGYRRRQRVPIPWTAKAIRELSILARLRRVLSLQALRGALAYLRTLGHNPLSQGRFAVVNGNTRQLVKLVDEKQAIELLGKHRGQLVIPLDLPTIPDEDTTNGTMSA